MASENSELALKASEQNLVQLGQTAVIAQNNFVMANKMVDADAIKGGVNLEEATGIREVASKSVPAGPTSV